jgi:ribonuclease D
MHSYFEKVCLLQIATPGGAFIIDPLRLKGKMGPLAASFGSRAKRKIFHGADYDIVCLKRDFGFEILNVFDTMVAAQFLGVERFGLADLVRNEFGASLDKRHARTNWARRPLSQEELEYSYLDVKYLIELAERLDERLAESGIREEAQVEFRRLEERVQPPKKFDPDAYMKIRRARELSEPELAILRELFLMRDRQAQKIDRPPFKVLANETMLRIASAGPSGRDELARIKGATPYVLRRYGELILRAVERGRKKGKPPPPRPGRPRGERLSIRRQKQLERLRDWRKARAAERGVPTLVVLTNQGMLDIVKASPRDAGEIGRLPTVGKKRAKRYGREILEILRG